MKTNKIVILLIAICMIAMTGCSKSDTNSSVQVETKKPTRIDIWNTKKLEVFISIDPEFYITDKSLIFNTYWNEPKFKGGTIQVYGLNIDGKEYKYVDEENNYYTETISDFDNILSGTDRMYVNRDNLVGAETVNLKDAENIQIIAGIFDNNLNKVDVIIDFIPNKLTLDN